MTLILRTLCLKISPDFFKVGFKTKSFMAIFLALENFKFSVLKVFNFYASQKSAFRRSVRYKPLLLRGVEHFWQIFHDLRYRFVYPCQMDSVVSYK